MAESVMANPVDVIASINTGLNNLNAIVEVEEAESYLNSVRKSLSKMAITN